MCGIAGLWAQHAATDNQSIVVKMTDAITRRGPDSDGHWQCDKQRVVLGHRRLAVIEPTPAGAQPMASDCERYVITFNGEIYNHLDIRQKLDRAQQAPMWRSGSDTETLLAAISAWGVKTALHACIGMFAFALWDKQSEALTLARDRMGEKPLYYGCVDASLIFASELKALRQFPEFKPSINRTALHQYMQTSSISSPLSIYNGVVKLPPACFVTFFTTPNTESALPEPEKYWQLSIDAAGSNEPTSKDQQQALFTQVDLQIASSVEQQMIADVPFGAFLSGGYDSSLVVAMMQQASASKVRTFAIGFEDEAFNEAPHARAVANHIGTDHTEMIVSPTDALNLISELPQIWDEPFADPSQLPTYLVSAMTREHVTVSLSGDGGDELFGGYERYQKALDIWSKVGRIPGPLRACMDRFIVPVLNRQSASRSGAQQTESRMVKARRLAYLAASRSNADLYRRLMLASEHADKLVLPDSDAHAHKRPADFIQENKSQFDSFLNYMTFHDLHGYLPDTILTKVDRASMAVSLEARAPLLDHELVELAWSLPVDLKIRNGSGKWLLKEVAHKYVPKSILDRPKTGFGIPLNAWLRGPLKDWGAALIEPNKLNAQGYLNSAMVKQLWDAHQSGEWEHGHILWNILMFQAWLEHSEHANE